MATVTAKKINSPFLGSINLSAFKKFDGAAKDKMCETFNLSSFDDVNISDQLEQLTSSVEGKTALAHLVRGYYSDFYIFQDRYVIFGYTGRRIVDLETGMCWSWNADYVSDFSSVDNLIKEVTSYLPVAVVVPSNGKPVLLETGDDTSNDNSGYLYGTEPFQSNLREFTISIRCLTRSVSDISGFEAGSDIEALDAALRKGIFMVDATHDQTLEVSKEIKAAWDKDTSKNLPALARRFTAPSAGYVLRISGSKLEWHRSPNIVLNIKGVKGSMLFGVDESSYFCCELKERVNTVNQAFKSLTPAEARKAGVLRQGEWYMVPVSTKSVPAIEACDFLVGGEAEDTSSNDLQETGSTPGSYYGMALSVENPTSARHVVESTQEIRIQKGKVFAMAPTLRHMRNEHIDIRGISGTWYTFVRNTAVRSYGEANVD